MSKKILVTDSLFIFEEHIKQLKAAGFEIERLDTPNATEEELCGAVKGKVGYIMGGVEHVTNKVIEAADELRAIVFSGSDVLSFVPGHELAAKRGIALASAPGANSGAVAEYAITLLLIMLRRVLELSNTGDKTFITTKSVSEVQIGIVGLGRIGQKVASLLKGLGATDIVYWSRKRKEDIEQKLGITYMPLEDLMKTSDIVTNHLSSEAGTMINQQLLSVTKHDVIIINTGSHLSLDYDALFALLSNGKARAALDDKIDHEGLQSLAPSVCLRSNDNAGYNTYAANKLASDMSTQSMINLLTTGKDQYLVNLN